MALQPVCCHFCSFCGKLCSCWKFQNYTLDINMSIFSFPDPPPFMLSQSEKYNTNAALANPWGLPSTISDIYWKLACNANKQLFKYCLFCGFWGFFIYSVAAKRQERGNRVTTKRSGVQSNPGHSLGASAPPSELVAPPCNFLSYQCLVSLKTDVHVVWTKDLSKG